MKQTQEFDGKNVDDAVEKACSTLNVSKKKLVFDVISTGSSGIFGIVGVKKARIRVTLPEKNNVNRSRNGADGQGADRVGVMSIVDEAFADMGQKKGGEAPSDKGIRGMDGDGNAGSGHLKKGGAKKKKHPGKRDGQQKPSEMSDAEISLGGDEKSGTLDTNRSAEASQPDEKQSTAPLSGSKSTKPRAKTYHKKGGATGKKPYRHRNVAKSPDLDASFSSSSSSDAPDDQYTTAVTQSLESAHEGADAPSSQPTAPSDDAYFPKEDQKGLEMRETGVVDSDDTDELYDDRDEGYPPKYKGEIPVDVSEEAVRVGQEALQKMVSLITEDATVVAETDEDRLLLRVEGGNSGVLIGRRGQTLEAMQFLTDKIINRCSESRVRLKVDIEGYMETRKANLQSLAFKMADKAKKTGKPATINQMTAQDRRIVHLTLKDDHRVRTQSMGDGYYRRLVIFPKKGAWKRRKNYRKQGNDN